MARLLPTKPLKHLRALLNQRRSQRRGTAGFTLIELLVSIIIGAIITVLLLSLVVELTSTNQQDAARTQVQQDMQSAIDYMAQDLREAVFVYNGDCLKGNGTIDSTNLGTVCPGVVNYIPTSISQIGRTPVLAFWRANPVPPEIRTLCKTNAPTLDSVDSKGVPTNPLVLKGVPCLSQATYSLVVYATDTSNDSNIWKGKGRLIRYELSQFPNNPTSENDQISGYVSPFQDTTATFQQWPYGIKADKTFGLLQETRPNNPPFTLVDFVDVDATGSTPTCDGFASAAALAADATVLQKALSPPGSNGRGFYACVRNGGVGAALAKGENQEVLLTLIGNVSGQSGFPLGNDNQYRLSPLQTRVLVRGVVQKVTS